MKWLWYHIKSLGGNAIYVHVIGPHPFFFFFFSSITSKYLRIIVTISAVSITRVFELVFFILSNNIISSTSSHIYLRKSIGQTIIEFEFESEIVK